MGAGAYREKEILQKDVLRVKEILYQSPLERIIILEAEATNHSCSSITEYLGSVACKGGHRASEIREYQHLYRQAEAISKRNGFASLVAFLKANHKIIRSEEKRHVAYGQTLLLDLRKRGKEHAWLAKKLQTSRASVDAYIIGRHLPPEKTRKKIERLLAKTPEVPYSPETYGTYLESALQQRGKDEIWLADKIRTDLKAVVSYAAGRRYPYQKKREKIDALLQKTPVLEMAEKAFGASAH